MDNILEQTSAVLTATSNYWQNLTQSVSPELLTQPPAPGEWSAMECLQHIIDVEGVMRTRLDAFMAGENFPGFDPDSQGSAVSNDVSPQAVCDKFVQLRTENLKLLASITPADHELTAIHGELGQVTLGQMLHHWAGHDLNHTVQAERALLQQFIAGVGPWKQFYSDHIANGGDD